MLELYYTRRPISSKEFIAELFRECGITAPVLRGENGKPFLADHSRFFSVSHTDELTAVAFSDQEVGLDAERADETRRYDKILSALSPAERAEIKSAKDFFAHWTAKESYVKFRGETLGKLYRRLSFVGGRLLQDEKPLPVSLHFGTIFEGKYIFCICNGSAEKIVCEER